MMAAAAAAAAANIQLACSSLQQRWMSGLEFSVRDQKSTTTSSTTMLHRVEMMTSEAMRRGICTRG
jgi:hypothetical protein